MHFSPKKKSTFAVLIATLAFLPACNLGNFSFSSKPTTQRGSPTQLSGVTPVPVKFRVKIQDELSSVVPFELGLCSPAMTIEAITEKGDKAAVRVRTLITLTGVSAAKLFTDDQCVAPVATDGLNALVEIAKGTGSTQIYMKTSQLSDASTYNLVMNSSGFQASNRSLRVDQTVRALTFGENAGSAAASASTAGSGVCESYFVNGLNGINLPFFTGSISTTIRTDEGLFYPSSAGGCIGSGSSTLTLNMTTTPSTRQFYFRSGQFGASTIGRVAVFRTSSQFPEARYDVTMIPKPVRFEFSSVPSENVLSRCSTFSIRLLDAGGNSVNPSSSQSYSISAQRVTPSGNPGTLSSTCGGSAISSISINSGTSSASFVFQANTTPADAEKFTVTATPSSGNTATLRDFGGLTSAEVPFRAELREITLTNTFADPRLFLCNGPYSYSVFDGRPSKPFTKGGTITLNQPAGAGRRYFTDANCSSEIAGGVINIPSSSSSGTYYFTETSNLTAGNTTSLSITATGPTIVETAPATRTITVSNVRNPLDQGGIAIESSMNGSSPQIAASLMQSAGKLIVVGHSTSGSTAHMMIGRFSLGGTPSLDSGSKRCTLSLPGRTNPSILDFSTVTASRAEAVVSNGSNLFVGGTADVTKTHIELVQNGFEPDGVTPHFDEVRSDTPTRQYFVARFDSNFSSCPSTGNNGALFIGEFSSGNLGHSALALAIDGGILIVGGDTGEFNASSGRNMAFALHSSSNLSSSPNPGAISFPSVASSAKFIAVRSSGEYYLYGNAGTEIGVAQLSNSGSTIVHGTSSLGGASFVGATISGGDVYLAARRNSNGAAIVAQYRFFDPENPVSSFNDSNVQFATGGGGIAVYDSSFPLEGGKIVIAGTAENSGNRTFLVARYRGMGGSPDSLGVASKAQKTIDFSGTQDEAKGLYILSDGRLIIPGIAGSNVGVSSLFQR